MHHSTDTLDTLIRPRILVVAARHALCSYSRERELPRLLALTPGTPIPGPRAALRQLIEREAKTEARRLLHDGRWRASHHVALMCALIAEARVCAAQKRDQSVAVPSLTLMAGQGGCMPVSRRQDTQGAACAESRQAARRAG